MQPSTPTGDSAAEKAAPEPIDNHLASSKKFKKAVKAWSKISLLCRMWSRKPFSRPWIHRETRSTPMRLEKPSRKPSKKRSKKELSRPSRMPSKKQTGWLTSRRLIRPTRLNSRATEKLSERRVSSHVQNPLGPPSSKGDDFIDEPARNPISWFDSLPCATESLLNGVPNPGQVR